MKILNRKKTPNVQDKHRKTLGRGQAIVEFALVFPILIFLLFGLIEVGRLIFIYGSVVTASREAARYGSTAGLISSDSDYFRYQDCEGIAEKARGVAFLSDPSSMTVTIEYDSGEGDGRYQHTCTPTADGVDPNVDVSPLADGTLKRIVVTVSTPYSPIVPLIPFSGFSVQTTSARTFLGAVEYWPE